MGRHSAFGTSLLTAALSALCAVGLLSTPVVAATTGSLTVLWNANTTDNCPAVYNPGQQNTDADTEGGDACDITIVYPLSGDVTCADPPPTIMWTPEIYTTFKVSIGTTPTFTTAVSSGKRWLGGTSWTVPASSWSAICGKLSPNLYIRVLGRSTKTNPQEYSETQTIVVR